MGPSTIFMKIAITPFFAFFFSRLRYFIQYFATGSLISQFSRSIFYFTSLSFSFCSHLMDFIKINSIEANLIYITVETKLISIASLVSYYVRYLK